MTRPGSLGKAHRLLAPRVAFLIGTRSLDGESNLIPVSNVTSVSVDPELIAVTVLRRWNTFSNLMTTDGFTLSVPKFTHMEGVWKLGSRYSRFPYNDNAEKLRDCGLALIDTPSQSGPILADGLGWMECHTIRRPDIPGDHGLFICEIVQVEFEEATFSPDGEPTGPLRPLMQVTGNLFTTTTTLTQIPYGPGPAIVHPEVDPCA